MKSETETVVAALPGFELLYLNEDNEGNWLVVEAHPVIAWRIKGNDREPIAPDHLGNEYVVRYPNGKISEFTSGLHDSLEACFAAMKRDRTPAAATTMGAPLRVRE
jgi:hypothetical protein